jgi:hypothetical protein
MLNEEPTTPEIRLMQSDCSEKKAANLHTLLA